jgi:LysM repeat protein
MFMSIARTLAIVGVAGLLSFTSGCKKDRGVSEAQNPPPPSLSAPVRVEEQPVAPQPATVTVVPAEEYAFLKDRQAPASTPLPSVTPAANEMSSPGAKPDYYTMQKGDTLYGIARKYNIPPKQLLAANSFPNPDRLPVGTKVKLP